MYTVKIGTEKQVKYANDIIRKPIANVEKHIAEVEETAAIYQEKFNERLVDLDIIPILRNAIELYSKAIDQFDETLAAKDVIDNYHRYNMYQRMMWKCLSIAFKQAGLDGSNQTVANWAAP